MKEYVIRHTYTVAEIIEILSHAPKDSTVEISVDNSFVGGVDKIVIDDDFGTVDLYVRETREQN